MCPGDVTTATLSSLAFVRGGMCSILMPTGMQILQGVTGSVPTHPGSYQDRCYPGMERRVHSRRREGVGGSWAFRS